jgi:hypothetical protein
MVVHVIVEGTIVSRRPVPMCPQLMRCHLDLSDEGGWKLSTSGESTSRKSPGHQCGSRRAVSVIPGDGTEVRRGSTYEQGESRRGEER